jgi:hypothetical protein
VALQERKPNQPAMPMPRKTGQFCLVNSEVPIRIRVISGSSAWKVLKTLWNCGITKMFTTAIAATIAMTTKLG